MDDEDAFEGTNEDEGVGEAGQGENDKVQLLPSSHYIGDKYLWEVTEKSEPFLTSMENDKMFIAQTDKIDIAEKLGKDKQPRFLQDEGMYIGVTPNVTNRNQNKLEHRILKEQETNQSSSKWFGNDGKLVAQPNPIMKKATRPPIFDEDLNDEPLTYFCPPTLPGPEGLPAPVNPSGSISSISKCQLEIDLASIVFDHHHLFSLEHYLTRRLSEAYVIYGKTKVGQASKDLEKRLDILHKSVDDLKASRTTWNEGEKVFQSRRLDTYRSEIKTIRAEKDADSLKERELTRSLLKIWKEIRAVRNQQGYTNTSHKLIIKKESVNVTQDKQKWDLEIKRELQEIKEEFDVNFEEKMKQFETDMDKWKFMHSKSLVHNILIHTWTSNFAY